MLKNVKKVSQKAFWGFLAASQKNVQKMSGKCPGAGAGAGKMSRTCQKNVPRHPPDIFQTFFDIFWQIESQARAPPFGWRPKAATSLFAKKCQKNVWKRSGGHLFDIFWTFFQRQPQHQDIFHTFFGHFSWRLPGSPKRSFGTFF